MPDTTVETTIVMVNNLFWFILNICHCQSDPFKFPPNSLQRPIGLQYIMGWNQTLELWIFANCLLELDYQILLPKSQFN